MTPGVTVCLADGTYSGLELAFGGEGTEAQPIKVAAETSGGVTIGGEVSINMTGSHVQLQGFIFKDGQSASSDFLQTRGNGNLPCNHCRITEISIIDFDQGSDNSGRWLKIYGTHNRIDHNWFSGKTTRATLLEVVREPEDGVPPEDTEVDYAMIDHNYFGDRPPADGKAYADTSDNEYEAIRIGTSDTHTGDSSSVVAHNYFERIQGEAEVISSKAGNNRIEHNTIRNSYGSITTRHGSGTTIANNFIVGDDFPFSGGIRIIDDGHRVINNYIQGARFLSSTFHGGIVLTGSDGSTTNGYQQLTNVLVAHNTIVDSVNSLNVDGGKKPTNPDTVYLVNNVIVDAVGPVITQAADGLPETSTIAGNIFYGQAFSDDDDLTSAPGIDFIDAAFAPDSLGIYRQTADSPDLAAVTGADIGGFDEVTADMDGQTRADVTQAGADHGSDDNATRGLLNRFDVGPINYRPPVTDPHVAEIAIENHDFDSGDSGWALTDAEVITDMGEVFSRGASVRVTGPVGRVSQVVALEPDTDYVLSAFVKGTATLAADVGGTVYRTDVSSSSRYRFTTVAFNSGSATEATLYGAVDDFVVVEAAISDPGFANFSGSTNDDWTTTEGGTLGQVQGSSNSASGPDGSAKFKLNDDTELGNQRVSQLVEGIVPNTEYTFSMYALEKNDSPVTVTMGVFEGDTTNVLASQIVNYMDLEAADAPRGDDSFRQTTMTFNSGANTSLTVYAQYNPNTVFANGGSAGETEFRVDDFRLSYEGEPGVDATALFDSFRLVSH